MEDDESKGTLVEMTREECLELLASREVGRLGVVVDGQPMIYPVNYVLDGELVVFRNDAGTKLTHASLGRVAFEIDEVSSEGREGWSVMVTGQGREFTDALDETSVREQGLTLSPWASGEKGHWVRIVGPKVSGRRLLHSPH